MRHGMGILIHLRILVLSQGARQSGLTTELFFNNGVMRSRGSYCHLSVTERRKQLCSKNAEFGGSYSFWQTIPSDRLLVITPGESFCFRAIFRNGISPGISLYQKDPAESRMYEVKMHVVFWDKADILLNLTKRKRLACFFRGMLDSSKGVPIWLLNFNTQYLIKICIYTVYNVCKVVHVTDKPKGDKQAGENILLCYASQLLIQSTALLYVYTN